MVGKYQISILGNFYGSNRKGEKVLQLKSEMLTKKNQQHTDFSKIREISTTLYREGQFSNPFHFHFKNTCW